MVAQRRGADEGGLRAGLTDRVVTSGTCSSWEVPDATQSMSGLPMGQHKLPQLIER